MKLTTKCIFIFFAVLLLTFSLVASSIFAIKNYTNIFPEKAVKSQQRKEKFKDENAENEPKETIYKAVFASKTTDYEISKDDLKTAKKLFEHRLASYGVDDYSVVVNNLKKKIVVYFTCPNGEISAKSIISDIAIKPSVTFCSGTTQDTVILTNTDIASADFALTPDNVVCVYLEFTEEGTQKFANSIQALIGKPISIWMDDIMISAPIVSETMATESNFLDNIYIAGFENTDKALEFADLVNAALLPFELFCEDFKINLDKTE